ncbi:hypothetical protein LSCM1_08280 [Leishmania martiniquensis]|uniref:Gamma-glutamyl phosphate reductase-like protein n=1 Tax=Leishmania martiniquensis TaxID=1580590 RepID=A0A836HPH6_9TRYP|nr:hypothetical protein LSCM1_08280 [Leishmania martiniquensis]
MFRLSTPRWSVQNILHDIQAAVESRSLMATSSFAQRRSFLVALSEELHRNREHIIRANRRDCDLFGQQQQQRGTPSVTIPPTLPSASIAPTPQASSSRYVGHAGHPPFLVHSGHRLGDAHAVSVAAGNLTATIPATDADGGSGAGSPRRRSSLDLVTSASFAGSRDLSGAGATTAHDRASGSPAGTRCTLGETAEATVSGVAASSSPSRRAGGALPASLQPVPTPSSVRITRTEAGGGGGHLLITPDNHFLISPLRLDKLHTTIEYLLCQPDPIAIPSSCWLHDYAEGSSGAAAGPLREAGSSDAAADRSSLPPSSGGGPHVRGRCTRRTDRLEVFELSVPLGMVGILSRFRPRISIDAVAMGLFAGNTVLVDGGVSLYYTNMALMSSVRRALTAAGLSPSAVVCVESYDTAHRSTSEWLQLSDYVDLAVVCGPPKLYQFASRHSTIPLMRATGQFSSVYVDQSASFEVALEVILNSKFQKLAAANAVTTVIVHSDFPRYTELLLALAAEGAVLLGDVTAQDRVPDCVAELASEEEYQGLSQYGLRDAARTLCIKTVDSLAQALFFIESFGSKQSDCIVATDPEVCATYCRQVDTAVALVNASTRLSSGVPLGCGVDIAISTSKTHCRGPLTIEMMTTRKLVARSLSTHHSALR